MVRVGEPWGNTRYLTPDGVWATMYRGPRNACRFYNPDGEQIGPEHRNVVPAIVWAAYNGWIDADNIGLSVAMNAEVRANAKVRD